MARGKNNWTFKDVEKFLRKHGFTLHHVRGSHHYYLGIVGGEIKMPHIQFHGAKAIHPKTLSSVIKQSGIPEEEWLA